MLKMPASKHMMRLKSQPCLPKIATARKMIPAMPLHMLPVIHARALELPIVELKAERFDEMQRRFRRGA